MEIEKVVADFFQMSDAVWERHANPWSVWTRYPCLPLLSLAVWSRIWIGWLNLLPIILIFLWIWLNPRIFGKPSSTDNWASRAVLGERIFVRNQKTIFPDHHQRAIRVLNFVTFTGFATTIYGLFALDVAMTVFGTIVTILGKTWFLDRMVWLYQDLSLGDSEYAGWLY